jgi:arginine/lysine/ornithine decarboxylase
VQNARLAASFARPAHSRRIRLRRIAKRAEQFRFRAACFITGLCEIQKCRFFTTLITTKLYKDRTQMLLPLHDFLENYARSEILRCHMPGHKGRYPNDITEIFDADCLYEAIETNGIIAASMREAARLFASGATFYSAGGCTLAVQTMLALAAGIGVKHVTATRYAHRSFVSAAILLGLEIDWVYPQTYLCADISPDIIPEGTQALFVTATDYYGGMCDIKALKGKCELLLADNAHGAYQIFTGEHPLRNGADFCADSAHKTLPALTGSAYLHVSKRMAAEYPDTLRQIGAQMAMFGSSSPPYPILDSLDCLNAHILNEREGALAALSAVAELKSRLSAHGYSIKSGGRAHITVNARDYGYSGAELGRLYSKAGVMPEYCDENYVVLLFSTITGEKFCSAVFDRVTTVPAKTPLPMMHYPELRPQVAMPPREAYFFRGGCVNIDIAQAKGRICARVAAHCPPCVPLVMPGEIIGEEEIHALELFGVKTVDVLR